MKAIWAAFWEGLKVGAMPFRVVFPRLLTSVLIAMGVLLAGIGLQMLGVTWVGEGLVLAGSIGACWAVIEGWIVLIRTTTTSSRPSE